VPSELTAETATLNHVVKTFGEVKKLITEAFVIRLPTFSKEFEVTCDTPKLMIGGVLSRENHFVAYFSKKLHDARQRYSTYDKKFYATMQALR